MQAWDSTLVLGYNPWEREKHEREALGSQKLSLKDHFLGYCVRRKNTIREHYVRQMKNEFVAAKLDMCGPVTPIKKKPKKSK